MYERWLGGMRALDRYRRDDCARAELLKRHLGLADLAGAAGSIAWHTRALP